MKIIQIEQKHREIVNKILYPLAADIYVFGSRAKGNARPLSDLDLCIKSKIDKSTLIRIKNELEESNLPYKVDIVLWSEISDAFKKHIEPDLIKFE